MLVWASKSAMMVSTLDGGDEWLVSLLSRTDMPVDLHTHSRFSDGSDTPTELVTAAHSIGLSTLALTDHDTQDGISEARSAADGVGLELIPGVEISCEWQPGTLHMVVLFLDPGTGPLQDRLARLQVGRATRNDRIVERLNDLGIDITLEEVAEEAGAGVTGRPHIAALLVRKGIVEDIRGAFDEYLGNGRPAYLGRERLTPETSIELALESGALPILSHPYTMGLDSETQYREAFGHLASIGLAGIDCYYPEYSPDEREAMAEVTRSFGMIPSGGSDYHGTYKEGLQLGTGWGDLVVADEVLDELKAARRTLLS